MKTAVVILNWNGAGVLPKFLPSVVRNTPKSLARIIVADNASTDGSPDYAKGIGDVQVIALDKNYGFADGYNRVISMLDDDYVVLLNSDVEVAEGWLEPLVAYLDSAPQCVAVQPKILSYRNKKYFEHAGAAGGLLDRHGYPYCYGRVIDRVAEDNGQYDTVKEVFWVSGACMCVRRKQFVDNGGLDSRFFAHMEEIDLCWRLKARGWAMAYVPASVVWHYGGASLPYNNPKKTYLNFRNNLLMIYKNAPEQALRHILSVRFVLDYLAVVMMLLTLQFSNVKAVWNARRDFKNMRRDFDADRKSNMEQTTVQHPVGWTGVSVILTRYFSRKTI